MFDFIYDNYAELMAAAFVCYTFLFMYANKVFNNEYSAGIIILAIVVCSISWPLSAPYLIIGSIVDITHKRLNNDRNNG